MLGPPWVPVLTPGDAFLSQLLHRWASTQSKCRGHTAPCAGPDAQLCSCPFRTTGSCMSCGHGSWMGPDGSCLSVLCVFPASVTIEARLTLLKGRTGEDVFRSVSPARVKGLGLSLMRLAPCLSPLLLLLGTISVAHTEVCVSPVLL